MGKTNPQRKKNVAAVTETPVEQPGASLPDKREGVVVSNWRQKASMTVKFTRIQYCSPTA